MGEINFSGQGIHTGQKASICLRPAPPNHGRVFVNPKGKRVPALVDYALKCDRSTRIGADGFTINTPEHLLSALAAAAIDNVEIAIDGEELPILDGSSLPFWEALLQVGRKDQQITAPVIRPTRPIVVGQIDGPLVVVLPAASPCFEYALYYPHPMLLTQTASFSWQQDYGKTIAPARTFALWEEVESLLNRGLAQGGNLDNALIIYQDRFSSDLRLQHEPARHKCLDLIGDFALLGARLQAKVLAVRAGHHWHLEAAKKVWQNAQELV